jgi:hypothetical protein
MASRADLALGTINMRAVVLDLGLPRPGGLEVLKSFARAAVACWC